MNKLKFAIIGCGRIAQRHAEHINNNGKLIAVCDIVKDKADALASQYGAVSYTDISDLIKNVKEIDVVSICSHKYHEMRHTLRFSVFYLLKRNQSVYNRKYATHQ